MKKITTLFSALVLTAFGWQANAQSVTATYSAGDINTNDLSYSTTCNGPTTPLVVTLPAGTWQVDSVNTAYDITAQSGAWMSEQRSQLGCSETATNEGTYATGTGNTGGTINYARTGLTFANGLHTGNVTFEMQAYRTWAGTAGCNNVQFIPDGTWTVEVFYSTPPTCPQPTFLADSNVTATSAVLYWSEVGSATAWEVELDTTGFTATGTPTHPGIADSNITATGLMPNTTYDYYVRAVCGAGDSSLWSGPHTFTTSCSSIATPFFEDFSSTSANQACWTVINNNGDADAWDMNYTGNPLVGDEVAAITTDFNSGNNDDYLVSPTLTLTNNNQLNFSYRVQSAGEPDQFQVLVSTTGGDNPANFTDTIMALDTVSNTAYQDTIIDLSAYTGDINIAFHVPNGGPDGWRLYIDAVRVAEECKMPTAGIASAITSSSAELGWTTTGTAASNWSIEYGPAGFTQGTGNVINGTSFNPHPVAGLLDGTDYDFYIISNCALGEKSAWAGPFNFTTYITGVGENTEINEVSIYPNPNNGVFTLNVNANDARVNVMNTQGQVILSKNVLSKKESIDLSNNAKGIYFVTVTSENGVSTHKVTVQ